MTFKPLKKSCGIYIKLEIYNCFIWAIKVYSSSRRLVSLVGKLPVHRVKGLGWIPGQSNNQGLKIFEEKVMSLL